MKCEKCEGENPQGARYCYACGTEVARETTTVLSAASRRHCSACGYAQPEGDFCQQCGQRLVGASGLAGHVTAARKPWWDHSALSGAYWRGGLRERWTLPAIAVFAVLGAVGGLASGDSNDAVSGAAWAAVIGGLLFIGALSVRRRSGGKGALVLLVIVVVAVCVVFFALYAFDRSPSSSAPSRVNLSADASTDEILELVEFVDADRTPAGEAMGPAAMLFLPPGQNTISDAGAEKLIRAFEEEYPHHVVFWQCLVGNLWLYYE